MSAQSLQIPEYILEGIQEFQKARYSKRAKDTSFDSLYSTGVLPLVTAQKHMNLKDHGLGAFEDAETGAVWILEDGYIYRVPEDA